MGRTKAPANSRISPRKVRAAERQRAALELRKAGASYPQIAAELGYAHARAAQKAVETGLHAYLREPAEELLRLELDRLDRMQVGIYSQAVSGDLAAIQIMLRIMERRAKYTGLDAPTKANVVVDKYQQVNVSGAVMVIRSDGNGGAVAGPVAIQGPKDDYIAGLKAMRSELPLAIAGRQGEAIEGTSRPTTDGPGIALSHDDDQDDT
jgi:hypothetical protein